MTAQPGRRRSLLLPLLLVLAAVLAALSFVPAQRDQLAPRDGPSFKEARTWGYQLQRMKPSAIPAAVDVLVIDYSRDGSDEKALTDKQVKAFQTRAGGGQRIVLSYLSIGEAEDYRYYWWPVWKVVGPAWLGRENKEWKGNYPVRFWHKGWQDVIFKGSASLLDRTLERAFDSYKPYVDRIIEAGFDGVYLDRVDVFSEWESSQPEAKELMVAFVRALSAYAKSRKPGFLIVPQNGEELLSSAAYRKAIDGIAKEDLLYGIKGDGKENPEREITRSTALLETAKAEGLPVLVVEYLSDKDQSKRDHVLKALAPRGFIPLFAERGLSKVPAPVTVLPLVQPANEAGSEGGAAPGAPKPSPH